VSMHNCVPNNPRKSSDTDLDQAVRLAKSWSLRRPYGLSPTFASLNTPNAPRSRGAVPGTDRYRLACLSSELPDQIDPLSGSSGRAAPGDNRLRQRHTDAREFRLRPPCRLYSPTVG